MAHQERQLPAGLRIHHPRSARSRDQVIIGVVLPDTLGLALQDLVLEAEVDLPHLRRQTAGDLDHAPTDGVVALLDVRLLDGTDDDRPRDRYLAFLGPLEGPHSYCRRAGEVHDHGSFLTTSRKPNPSDRGPRVHTGSPMGRTGVHRRSTRLARLRRPIRVLDCPAGCWPATCLSTHTRGEVSQAADTVPDPLFRAGPYRCVRGGGSVVAGRRGRRRDRALTGWPRLIGPMLLAVGTAMFAIDHPHRSGPSGWCVRSVPVVADRARRLSAVPDDDRVRR